MKTITKPTKLYRFLKQQLASKDGVSRYPKRLAEFASHLIDWEMPGRIEKEDLEIFFEGEIDLQHPLITASELLYHRTIENSNRVRFSVAKMRLAMWIINSAIECHEIDHFNAIVAMIRYLQLDRPDCLCYAHPREGLRVSSGKEFERKYGVRVRVRPPHHPWS